MKLSLSQISQPSNTVHIGFKYTKGRRSNQNTTIAPTKWHIVLNSCRNFQIIKTKTTKLTSCMQFVSEVTPLSVKTGSKFEARSSKRLMRESKILHFAFWSNIRRHQWEPFLHSDDIGQWVQLWCNFKVALCAAFSNRSPNLSDGIWYHHTI